MQPDEPETVLLLQIMITALLLTRITASIGYRRDLTDMPGWRKQHLYPVPLTDGIAIFLTILSGIPVTGTEAYSYPLLLIACLVFAADVFDDLRHLSAALRLLIQFCSGLLLATWGGIAIHNVGNRLATGDIPLLMVVPLAVFLLFNLGPDTGLLPRVFLGDGGSMTLGFLVTASLIFFPQGDNALIRPVTALWLVTVPLMDMLATMLRRARAGRRLMVADCCHLHHTLLDMGLGPRQTLLLIMAYASLCALLGLALERGPAGLSLLAYSLLFCSHCLFVITASRGSDIPSNRDVRAERRCCERGFLRAARVAAGPAALPNAGNQ
jgi:UDP-GlcNAc:undecaprenyl-phosphate GlcNAc-1-phosphate transferase